jgi:hypothetical protein
VVTNELPYLSRGRFAKGWRPKNVYPQFGYSMEKQRKSNWFMLKKMKFRLLYKKIVSTLVFTYRIVAPTSMPSISKNQTVERKPPLKECS